MFGYVTVCEPELKVKDLKNTEHIIVGCVVLLKEDYGFMGQMTLTYDMTFAVILLSSLYMRGFRTEEAPLQDPSSKEADDAAERDHIICSSNECFAGLLSYGR